MKQKYRLSLLAWLVPLLMAPALRAGEKIDFRGIEGFRSAVLDNEVLEIAGVATVTADDGKDYLLGLGTTASRAGDDSSVRARLDTLKIAEARARKAAAEFLKVEVSVESRLVELRKTEKVSGSAGVMSRVTRLVKTREEVIAQKSRIVFAGSKTVATWLGDGGDSFNAVIAFQITGDKTK